ncbi:hypothetical protein Zm00014a_033581, partial [Zea mays]
CLLSLDFLSLQERE